MLAADEDLPRIEQNMRNGSEVRPRFQGIPANCARMTPRVDTGRRKHTPARTMIRPTRQAQRATRQEPRPRCAMPALQAPRKSTTGTFHFGMQAVPEPASLISLALAGGTLLLRRRRIQAN